jgi:hypothetical protein
MRVRVVVIVPMGVSMGVSVGVSMPAKGGAAVVVEAAAAICGRENTGLTREFKVSQRTSHQREN